MAVASLCLSDVLRRTDMPFSSRTKIEKKEDINKIVCRWRGNGTRFQTEIERTKKGEEGSLFTGEYHRSCTMKPKMETIFRIWVEGL